MIDRYKILIFNLLFIKTCMSILFFGGILIFDRLIQYQYRLTYCKQFKMLYKVLRHFVCGNIKPYIRRQWIPVARGNCSVLQYVICTPTCTDNTAPVISKTWESWLATGCSDFDVQQTNDMMLGQHYRRTHDSRIIYFTAVQGITFFACMSCFCAYSFHYAVYSALTYIILNIFIHQTTGSIHNLTNKITKRKKNEKML